jgi:hypothetical protein
MPRPGTQPCSSRDIEHLIIGSVDRTVGIAVLQFARGGQCGLGFKSKVSSQEKASRDDPVACDIAQETGPWERSGFNQCLNEMGTG